MVEKLNAVAGWLDAFNNSKITRGIAEGSGKAFKLLFCISGVLLISQLFPGSPFIELFESNYLFLLLSVPTVLAYSLGKELKSNQLGAISALAVIIYNGYVSYGYHIISSIIITLLSYGLLLLFETVLNKFRVPRWIPSMVLEVVKDWFVEILALVSILIILSVLKGSQIITFLASLIHLVGTSPIYYIILLTSAGILWFYGLHGDQLTGSLIELFLFTSLYQNMIPWENLSIINSSFHVIYASSTGSGITGCLIIAYLLLYKDKNKLNQAKENVSSAVFNINEGVIFGFPVMGNKSLSIPFIIAPLVSVIYAYVLTSLGYLVPFTYAVPWVTPPLIKSFLASGGNLVAVGIELGMYVIVTILYIPFVIKNQKEEVNE